MRQRTPRSTQSRSSAASDVYKRQVYCDIYPLQLPCRYVNKIACYEKVYIISNWELERQYEQQQTFDAETWKAFLRRIKRVITYDEDGTRTEYASVEEYMNRNKGDDFYEV